MHTDVREVQLLCFSARSEPKMAGKSAEDALTKRHNQDSQTKLMRNTRLVEGLVIQPA